MPLLDTFTAANGTDVTARSSDSGHTIAVPSGGTSMFIDDNRAHANAGFTIRPFYSWVPDSPDYTVEFPLHVKSVVSGNGVGIIGRSLGETYTGYVLRLDPDAGQWQLLRLLAGAAITLGTASQTVTAGATYVARLIMDGDQISAEVDGVEVIPPVTNDHIAGAGTVALFSNNSASATTGLHIDGVAATEIVSFGAGADTIHEPWDTATLTGTGAGGSWSQDPTDSLQVTITPTGTGTATVVIPPTRDGAVFRFRFGDGTNYDTRMVTALPATHAMFGDDLAPIWLQTTMFTEAAQPTPQDLTWTFDTEDLDGWLATPNTILNHETVKTASGGGAARVTSIALGEAKLFGPAVTVDHTKQYAVECQVAAGTTVRSTGVQIDWFDAVGTYISSAMEYVPNTVAYGTRTIPSTPPPSNAETFQIAVVFVNVPAGEYHYLDEVVVNVTDRTVEETVIVDDTFDRTSTIDQASRSDPAEPFFWPEWDSWPYVISNGTMTRTGNTGFDRLFSKFRFGGPGKTVRFSWRARITTYHDDGGWSGHRGLKVGMKFPSANSTYDKDDILSVGTTPSPGGGNYTVGQAAGIAPVVGFTDTGDYEVITLGYDTRNYIGFHYGDTIAPAVAGTYYDKSQEIAWLPDGTIRVRLWENFDLTGTPAYEKILTGEEAFQDAGYLWLRLDYVDTQFERFRVVERSSPGGAEILWTPEDFTLTDPMQAFPLDQIDTSGARETYGTMVSAAVGPGSRAHRNLIPAGAAHDGWRAIEELGGDNFPRDSVALEYTLRFDDLGGLPTADDAKIGYGVAGGPAGADMGAISQGGTKNANSWYARLNTIRQGYHQSNEAFCMTTYLYAESVSGSTSSFGVRHLLRNPDGDLFTPVEDVDYDFRWEIIKNNPGVEDGRFRVFIDGVEYCDRSVQWNPSGYDVPISHLMIQSFSNTALSSQALILMSEPIFKTL